MNSSKNPAALRYDYVLVIEFLSAEEPQTGTDLVRQLRKKESLPLRFISCSEPSDIIAALSAAKENIPDDGYPIIHLEAHGINAKDSKRSVGIGHECSNKKQKILMWEVLWDALRDLNVATDFNLIVVVAACQSGDVAYGITHKISQRLPLPFMATVGFDSTVRSDRLLEAFIAFYQSLLKEKSLEKALASANKNLVSPEILVHQWTVAHLLSAFKATLYGKKDERDEAFWKLHLANTPDAKVKDKERIVNEIASFQLPAIQEVMGHWLSYETHPHNQSRFSFLIEMASTSATPRPDIIEPK